MTNRQWSVLHSVRQQGRETEDREHFLRDLESGLIGYTWFSFASVKAMLLPEPMQQAGKGFFYSVKTHCDC